MLRAGVRPRLPPPLRLRRAPPRVARAGVRRGEERERRLRRGVVELHERDRRVDVRFERARPRRAHARAVRARGAQRVGARAAAAQAGGRADPRRQLRQRRRGLGQHGVVGGVVRGARLSRSRSTTACAAIAACARSTSTTAAVHDVRRQRGRRDPPRRVVTGWAGMPRRSATPRPGAGCARRRRARRRRTRSRGVRLVGGRRGAIALGANVEADYKGEIDAAGDPALADAPRQSSPLPPSSRTGARSPAPRSSSATASPRERALGADRKASTAAPTRSCRRDEQALCGSSAGPALRRVLAAQRLRARSDRELRVLRGELRDQRRRLRLLGLPVPEYAPRRASGGLRGRRGRGRSTIPRSRSSPNSADGAYREVVGIDKAHGCCTRAPPVRETASRLI